MAQDASNSLTWYLLVNIAGKDQLGTIRHWSNLKMAFEENTIWVKDFDLTQVNSPEVKCIPYKKIFYSGDSKLYLKDSLLPDRNIPALLWTPMERGLPVTLPAFNHNYFGLPGKLSAKLVYSGMEAECHVMQVSLTILKEYIERAPSVRLQNLQWTIINNDTALLFGSPLLPLQGDAFYRKNDFLIPAGYDFDLHSLSDALNSMINPEGNNWILWNTDTEYTSINKKQLMPLSLGSFRLSLLKLSTV